MRTLLHSGASQLFSKNRICVAGKLQHDEDLLLQYTLLYIPQHQAYHKKSS